MCVYGCVRKSVLCQLKILKKKCFTVLDRNFIGSGASFCCFFSVVWTKIVCPGPVGCRDPVDCSFPSFSAPPSGQTQSHPTPSTSIRGTRIFTVVANRLFSNRKHSMQTAVRVCLTGLRLRFPRRASRGVKALTISFPSLLFFASSFVASILSGLKQAVRITATDVLDTAPKAAHTESPREALWVGNPTMLLRH